ncbi:MAG: NAD-dependent epimerase/dehydratase family protein [Bacteroidetes bacterium]|nr:NAD-dependent epimerase/dehydratase family protein [Bacteroidota bacterium]
MKNLTKDRPVLVTGAAGYIASWLVRYLLEAGYSVRGSVRSLKDQSKTEHLLRLSDQFPGKLTLHEADLLKEGSFDQAAQGCSVVYHTASPFIIGKIKDPQRTLVDPAVRGTRNVLDAATKSGTVQRVVLTSSIASVYGDPADIRQTANGVFTEVDWNTSSSLTHEPYAYSKVMAEKEAWSCWSKQASWDLVTVNPGFVLGPSLSKRVDGASMGLLLDNLKGKYKGGTIALYMSHVDVRDVANTHLFAGTRPEAKGRYLCCSENINLLEMAQRIEREFPGKFALPKQLVPKPLLYLAAPFLGRTWKFVTRAIGIPAPVDGTRCTKEFGFTYRPLSETYRDHVLQLKADGLVSF